MGAPMQQIHNGSFPMMSGVPQGGMPAIVYQQQPFVVAGGGQPHSGGNEYTHRKQYARNSQEEQCKIFVGGVGKGTTEESLRAYFGKFGEILDSVIMKDKHSGEPRGFAFVTFKSPEAVDAVIEQSNNGGHTLDGKLYLQVRKYFPKAEYDAEKQIIQASGGNPQYKGPMKVSPDLKIFVGGIGIGTSEEDVRNYFESFGKVLQVDMPFHHVYKCPKGFAFVGFESMDTVHAITKDRYHQINGKTVEVKGADEQQAHLNKKRAEGKPVNILTTMGRGQRLAAPMQPGNIATVSGYGAYANMGGVGNSPQVLIPQAANGLAQYVQVPPASAGGGYVFDPATNTYYQLPGTVIAGHGGLSLAGGAGGGIVTSVAAGAGFANPYGVAMLGGINGVASLGGMGGAHAPGGQVITSPQIQRGGGMVLSADMLGGGAGSNISIGAAYQNETSTFGPTRHILAGAAGQQPIAGSADPHVVYSTATSISAGDPAISTHRGFHPYGR